MGAFKDFFDTGKELVKEVESSGIFSSKQMKSLSKASMESIMYFPVLCSDLLSIEDASICSKALERQYATFVLSVMTMDPYTEPKGGEHPNAGSYIKRFHQNMGVKADSVDLVKTLNTFTTEAFNKLGIEYEVPNELCENMVYHIYENINHRGMNLLNTSLNFNIEEVTNSSILNESTGCRVLMEANTTPGSKPSKPGSKPHKSSNVVIKVPTPNGSNSPKDRQRLRYLMDNDVKKSNELVPTLLHMRVYPINKDTNQPLEPIDFVIGVKTTIHPVSSEDMIVNLCRGIKNDNTMFNFIRWTTGEIKFFKDFLFGINEIKIDAINSSNNANKWWTALKRRRNLNKIYSAMGRDRLLPNATIIITQDEIDTIKRDYGYELDTPQMIDKLMQTYFLLGFVIVDPALQRVKFMFDGRDHFETQTFATLSREQSTNDKQFKEMLNMLGRRI